MVGLEKKSSPETSQLLREVDHSTKLLQFMYVMFKLKEREGGAC